MDNAKNIIEIPIKLHNPKFRFIPIQKNSKIPIEKNWQTTNNYDFRKITDKILFLDSYGVAGGYDNLYIVDFDDQDTQDKIIKQIPETYSVKSGGNELLHLYFKDSDVPKSFKVIDKGRTLLDVQGKGKYVIGPNSIHADTKRKYEVVNDVPITEFPIAKLKEILKESGLLNNKEINTGSTYKSIKCKFHDDNTPSCTVYENKTFFCFGCNAYGFVNALEHDGEIKKKKTENGTFHYLNEGDFERYSDLKPTISSGNKDIDEILNLLGNRKTMHLARYKLAQYFLKEHHILTFKDTSEVFLYSDGVYGVNGDKRISSDTQFMLSEYCSVNLINELIAHIKRSTYKDREEIEEPSDKLCLENGILNLKTLEIEPHTPDIIFFNIF